MRIIRITLPAAFVLLAGCQDELTTTSRNVRPEHQPRPLEGFAARGEVRTGWIEDTNGGPLRVTFEVHEGRAIFEGDIDLGPVESIAETPEGARRPGGPRYGVIRNGSSYRWQNGHVYYTIDPYFDATQRQTIINAMAHIQSVNPGLTFYEYAASSRIHFRLNTAGCSSPIGRQGGVQEIKLVASCAYSMGTVAHEVLHSLGMRHEQSRCDRNYYVQINTQNIQSGTGHNFDRHCSDHTDIGSYDEGSLMHYGPYDFSANGLPTITSLRGLSHLMGQRGGLSAADVRTVDWMYPRPLSVSISYPGNVATLNWEPYPYATHYEVYLVHSENIRDPFDGDRSSESRSLVATTTGTSYAGGTWTGTSGCYWESGYTQYETSDYYEVWAYTSYIPAGVRKAVVGAEISNC